MAWLHAFHASACPICNCELRDLLSDEGSSRESEAKKNCPASVTETRRTLYYPKDTPSESRRTTPQERQSRPKATTNRQTPAAAEKTRHVPRRCTAERCTAETDAHFLEDMCLGLYSERGARPRGRWSKGDTTGTERTQTRNRETHASVLSRMSTCLPDLSCACLSCM